jgi:hypothetical protein
MSPAKERSGAAKEAKPKRKSPLLRSGLEVLEHGLWHFDRTDTPTDLKFAIMHVDQAIELFLKEKVRASGKSINKPKNSKETLGLYSLYDILEKELGCSIPEKADLELLHEERNAIQHKYLNPSAEDASFHIGNGVAFIARFLREELDENVYDYVPSRFLDEFLD